MGRYKRVKNIFSKIGTWIKDKVVKPVAKFLIKNAPGILNTILKVVSTLDKVGARRTILNLIPTVGPYINQFVDALFEVQKRGLLPKVGTFIIDLIDGKLTPQACIAQIKNLIIDVKDIAAGARSIEPSAADRRAEQYINDTKQILRNRGVETPGNRLRKLMDKTKPLIKTTQTFVEDVNELNKPRGIAPEEENFTTDEVPVNDVPQQVFGNSLN